MGEKIPTRQDAIELRHQYNETDSLRKHAYAVEGVMRYIARKRGEDEEKWGIIGLIHDLDYERFPDQHCSKTGEILREQGWPEEYIRGAVSHGWGICSDVMPQTAQEKALYAIDELTGLVVTTALIRPSKSVLDVQLKHWTQRPHPMARDRGEGLGERPSAAVFRQARGGNEMRRCPVDRFRIHKECHAWR